MPRFTCALDAVDEALRNGAFFESAIDAVEFSKKHFSHDLTVYERELKLSYFGMAWMESGDKMFIKPRLTAPLEEFMQTFIEKSWGLKRPDLIVSITGGALDFTGMGGQDNEELVRLQKRVERFFRRGLVRAISNRGNTWLVTGGFDVGCMKLAGDAVRSLKVHGHDVTTIGICTFGRISNGTMFMQPPPHSGYVYSSNDEPPEPGKAWLNPDHTHFIMVGDEDSEWGTEIQFRAELEDRYFSSGSALVQVVVNGGVGTINTVLQAVNNGAPVYILKGSGRVADMLACGMEVRSAGHLDVTKVLQKYRDMGMPELWRQSEERLYSGRIRDILMRGMLYIFDLNKDDPQSVEQFIMGLKASERKVAKTQLLRELDQVVQKVGTILGKVEMRCKPMLGTPRLVLESDGLPAHEQLNIAEYFRPPLHVTDEEVVSILKAKWGLNQPKLIVSVAGSRVESRLGGSVAAFFRGVVAACSEADGWVFTSALSKASAAYVGEAVSGTPVPAIGFVALMRVRGRRSFVTHGRSATLDYGQCCQDARDQTLDLLEGRHTHFVLVGDADDDNVVKVAPKSASRRSAGTMDSVSSRRPDNLRSRDPERLLRFRIEEYFRSSVAVVVIIMGGSVKTIYSALRSVRAGIPLQVATGTGGSAGVIEDLYNLRNEFRDTYSRKGEKTTLAIAERHASWVDRAKPLVLKGFPDLESEFAMLLDLIEDLVEIVEDGKLSFVKLSEQSSPYEVEKKTKQALLRVVIEQGTVGVTDSTSETSLMFAARTNNEEMARRMLHEGAIFSTPDRLSLLCALKHGNVAIARLICQRIYDTAKLPKSPTYHEIFTTTDDEIAEEKGSNAPPALGMTALMWAAQRNLVDILQQIEDTYRIVRDHRQTRGDATGRSGATMESVWDKEFLDLNNRNHVGETALHCAVRGGSVACVRWLLVRGADPLLPNPDLGVPPAVSTSTNRVWPGKTESPFQRSSTPTRRVSTSPQVQRRQHSVPHLQLPLTKMPSPHTARDNRKAVEQQEYYTPYQLALLQWQLQGEEVLRSHARAMKFQRRALQQQQEATNSPREGETQASHIFLRSGSFLGFWTEDREAEALAKRLETAEGGASLMDEIVTAFIVPSEDANISALEVSERPMAQGFKAIRRHRGWFAMQTFMQWFGGYVCFLVLVCVTASLVMTDMSNYSFYMQKHIGNSLARSPIRGSQWYRDFDDMVAPSDFWAWLRGPFSESVYGHDGRPGSVMASNVLVGRVRLRQLRVSERECTHINGPVTCYPRFRPETESKEPFSDMRYEWSRDDLNSAQFAVEHYYPDSGYVVELSPYNNTEALRKLDELEKYYLDDATRVVFADLTFYNEDLAKILIAHFAVEFFATGGQEQEWRMMQLRWVDKGPDTGEPRFDTRNVGYVVLELTLLLANIWMIFTEARDLADELGKGTHSSPFRGFVAYITAGFNFWDVLNILVFFILFGVHIAMLREAASHLGGGIYHDRYYNLHRLSWLLAFERDVLSIYVLTSFGKVLKYLQLIPRIGPVLQAILSTIGDPVIMAFIAFFLMFILVMSLSFHISFGTQMTRFHTLERSWFSVMGVMFGDIDASSVWQFRGYNGPHEVAGTGGVLFIVLLLAGNLIIMNVTIAVIGKVYEAALKEHSQMRWESMLTSLEAEALWDSLPYATETGPDGTRKQFRRTASFSHRSSMCIDPALGSPTDISSAAATLLGGAPLLGTTNDAMGLFPRTRTNKWKAKLVRVFQGLLGRAIRRAPVALLKSEAVALWVAERTTKNSRDDTQIAKADDVRELREAVTASMNDIKKEISALAESVKSMNMAAAPKSSAVLQSAAHSNLGRSRWGALAKPKLSAMSLAKTFLGGLSSSKKTQRTTLSDMEKVQQKRHQDMLFELQKRLESQTSEDDEVLPLTPSGFRVRCSSSGEARSRRQSMPARYEGELQRPILRSRSPARSPARSPTRSPPARDGQPRGWPDMVHPHLPGTLSPSRSPVRSPVRSPNQDNATDRLSSGKTALTSDSWGMLRSGGLDAGTNVETDDRGANRGDRTDRSDASVGPELTAPSRPPHIPTPGTPQSRKPQWADDDGARGRAARGRDGGGGGGGGGGGRGGRGGNAGEAGGATPASAFGPDSSDRGRSAEPGAGSGGGDTGPAAAAAGGGGGDSGGEAREGHGDAAGASGGPVAMRWPPAVAAALGTPTHTVGGSQGVARQEQPASSGQGGGGVGSAGAGSDMEVDSATLANRLISQGSHTGSGAGPRLLPALKPLPKDETKYPAIDEKRSRGRGRRPLS